ncbi:(2E,6E)-farnesyl diphosphate synthase [Pseudoalteromonas sp. DY56-GL22]|uniref:(2E,6E)-farnesyl diphosphate synthase n=1 Tax=Pseudoalteromonas sp. DY56-GL22 TaxID=2967126 RepID=UPI002E9F50D7|nr:(2E,6E)-farnesyl diphosphate synthase [Pseudomonadota bacterium]
MQLKEQLQRAREDVEAHLNRYFEQPLNTEKNIKEATHYGVLNGGKRLRPYLVYATGRMMGADKADLDILAAAIECIHSYSLVHDDLPAMDDDDLRRGRPTCHIVYGEAQAILAGDALQTLAFDLIANHQFAVSASQQVKMIASLSKASGIEGMVGGQALDIEATDKEITVAQLERIHQLKTGALLNCAITLGALSAKSCDEHTLAQLNRFGQAIGLAFQVQDDILDVEADTETLGKPQGSDVAANKATYPALLGMAGAKHKAQDLLAQAHQALEAIDYDTSELASLASYIVERNY